MSNNSPPMTAPPNGNGGPYLPVNDTVSTGSPNNEEDTVRLGGQIVCPGCGQPSNAGSKFCGGCGSRLWDPCVVCGEVNAVGKAFCGECGVDLAATLAEAETAAKEGIAKADSLYDHGRVLTAIEALDTVTIPAPDHTRLAPLGEQIKKLREAYQARREQALRESEQVTHAAKAFLEADDHRAALAEIEKIPVSLRPPALADLHERATERSDETKRLRSEIKERLAAKSYDGLLSVVQRLHTLEPNDPQVVKLMNQLGDRQKKSEGALATSLLDRAEKALAENDYPTAAKALKSLPAEIDPALTERVDRSMEPVWLARQLATAPHATRTAVKLAERFAKLHPSDSRLVKTVRQMQERYKQSLSDPGVDKIAWAKSGAKGQGAVLVDYATPPQPLISAARHEKESPAQFFTAYGLALQSIGLASLTANLTPKQGRWVGRLKAALSRKKASTGWGIDIGAHDLKAIRLIAPSEEGEPPVVEELFRIPVEADDRGYAMAVAEFAQRVELRGAAVVLNLPSTQTLGRFFELPSPDGKRSQFDEAVRFEAQARIPLKPDECVIDYRDMELHDPADTTGVETRHVALLGAKLQDAEVRLAPFANLGAASVTLSSTAWAALSASPDERGGESATALVDIGHTATTIAVCDSQCQWFRSFYGGVSDFNRALAKGLGVDRARADEARRNIDKEPRPHAVEEALLPAFEEYAHRLSRALDQFSHEYGRSITTLRLCGGGSESFGLLGYLRTGR